MSARKVTMIPGTIDELSFPLSRYRSNQVSGHVKSIIRQVTKPGDIVIEINPTGAACISETLQTDRRNLAININPVSMLITHIELNPVDVGYVRAALTRLGDLPKGQQSLLAYIKQQYATKCPHCHQEATAAWFAWDRDTHQPFAKKVHCANCETDREGAADEFDAQATNLNPTSGLAYHVALERASSNDESLRPRISELISLYTARNLSLLMDIIHRLPQTSQLPDIRRILTAFLLEALDQGSSLVPYANPEARPRSLKPPQLFLENNIWDVLEKAMANYTTYSQQHRYMQSPAASLQNFLESHQGYFLTAHTLASVVSRLDTNKIKLVIIHADVRDAVYCALSSLWGTWLWSSEKLTASFRSFMGRRRIDPDWNRRDIESTINELTHILDPQACLLFPITSNAITTLEDVLIATRENGYGVQSWLNALPDGYRLLMTPQAHQEEIPALSPSDYYAWVLRQRGEPATMQHLEVNCMVENPSITLDDLPSKLTDDFYIVDNTNYLWLKNEYNVEKPLADRVEETTLKLLQKQHSWRKSELEEAIYALYNGVETPEPEFVQVCIHAYTMSRDENMVSLRPEDTPKTRRQELHDSRMQIEQLGIHLGFTVGRRLSGDIVWKEPGKTPYLFRFSSTALLTPHLKFVSTTQRQRRCLVLPGGRAALVEIKLRRDPRLRQAMEQNNWVFIKFRHLRRMLVEVKHRGEIDFYLGLDPIVEKDTAQIPLPFD